MISVGWQTLFWIILPPELPNISSEWTMNKYKVIKWYPECFSKLVTMFQIQLMLSAPSDRGEWELAMADQQFSRGDLVWFDPGIGYVLPGEVTEFHPQAQVRNSDNSEELYSFTYNDDFYDCWFCIGVTSRLVLTNCSVLDARKWSHLVLDNESNCPIK